MTLRLLKATLLGGSLAGVIDIGAAALISGKPAATALRFIAAGLLGRGAMQDGTAAVLLGGALQEAMSLAIAAIFTGAAVSFASVRQGWIQAGALYGAGVFAVMNYLVLPLSALRHVPHFTPFTMAANLAAMVLFGLIVAGAAHIGLREDTEAAATREDELPCLARS
jgi:hypothetical protein